MKVSFLVLFCFACVKSNCINEFDSAEEKCAKPQNLNPTLIFYYFTRGYAYIDVPKVDDFVTCTWREWGFEDSNGTINYEKLSQDKLLPWKIARHCDDLVSDYSVYIDAFKKAISECQAKPPVNATTEKIRLCINSNYPKYVPDM